MINILFLQKEPIPQLGLMTISALARKQGYRVALLVENLEQDFYGAIRNHHPDLIAMSATTGQHNWACATAKNLQALGGNIPVILGGPHATFFPQVLEKDGLDLLCRGEGELAFVELLDRLSRSQPLSGIKNLWRKEHGTILQQPLRPLIQDLDALPFLDRSLYDRYRQYRLYYRTHLFVMTGRGCPFGCNYCFNRSLRHLHAGERYVRRRSVAHTMEELLELKQRYAPSGFQFLDDIFIADAEWLAEFCDRYRKEVAIPFTCTGHFLYLHREVIRNLKAAGCRTIKVGLEAGNEKIRRRVLGRDIGNEQIFEKRRLLAEEKLDLLLFNMMGYPDSRFQEEWETLEMNLRLRPQYAICYLIAPFPGTRFTEAAQRSGALDKDFDFDRLFTSVFSATLFRMEDPQRTVRLQRLFTFVVAFPFLAPLCRLLLRLPLPRIYNFIFQASYAVTLLRADGLPWRYFIPFGLKMRSYFKPQRPKD